MAVVLVAVVVAVLARGGSSTSTSTDVPTELQVSASSTTTGATTTAKAGGSTTTTAKGVTTTKPTATTAKGTKTTVAGSRDESGLLVVTPDQLPAEARTTLRLIDAGGPFPYSRDGIVFANREGRLPKRQSGYYHEYTVVTPGESDRGARRVIAGDGGERYYTADHYDSFVRVQTKAG